MVGCSGVFRLCLMNAIERQSVADEELVRQLAMGLDEALASLQQRYGSLLTSLASRRLDRPSAEEIVQDVFLTVWQHSPRFDPSRGSFRSWVFQIAHRIMPRTEPRTTSGSPGRCCGPRHSSSCY